MMVRIEYEGGRTTLFDTLSFTEGSPFSGANMLTEFELEMREVPEKGLWLTANWHQVRDDWRADAPADGIPAARIFRFGKEDNFWEHGSGPCGPCSEVFYDRGEKYGCGKPGCTVGCDCDRYVEVWNIVFSQFNNDGHGNYTELKQKNIDTGMGLERLACVCQNVASLFDVDTVMNITNKVSEITGAHYEESDKTDVSLRVITDHIRSSTFMICDGILPSNEGRGYVLRRLLRRAARHGRMLGINRPFLTELVETVIESSEAGYPELREHESYIKKVIGTEELRFGRTIDAGLNILTGMMGRLKEAHEKVLSGVEAFKLNDTFGFPLDLTREIAAEAGFAVDEAAFHIEMTKQRERARAERLAKDISGWSADLFGELTAEPTRFDGYETLSEKAKVLAQSDGEELVDAIATDEAGEAKDGVLVVLDRTPFYAEMGGQVADHGYLVSGDAKLKVTQVKKTPEGYFVHTCELLDGTIHVDDEVTASVDEKRRAAICRNHTATHLLQKALREALALYLVIASSDSSVLEITGITFTPDAQYSDLATVTVHYTVHAEGEVELSFGFGGTSIAENRQVTTKQPEEKPTEPTTPAETTPSTEPSEGPGGGPSTPTGGAEPRETTPSASMPSEAAPSEPVEPTAAVDPETIRMYALPDALALQLQGGGQAAAPGAADPVPVTVVTVQPEDDRKLLLLTGAGALALAVLGALCALRYYTRGRRSS